MGSRQAPGRSHPGPCTIKPGLYGSCSSPNPMGSAFALDGLGQVCLHAVPSKSTAFHSAAFQTRRYGAKNVIAGAIMTYRISGTMMLVAVATVMMLGLKRGA